METNHYLLGEDPFYTSLYAEIDAMRSTRQINNDQFDLAILIAGKAFDKLKKFENAPANAQKFLAKKLPTRFKEILISSDSMIYTVIESERTRRVINQLQLDKEPSFVGPMSQEDAYNILSASSDHAWLLRLDETGQYFVNLLIQGRALSQFPINPETLDIFENLKKNAIKIPVTPADCETLKALGKQISVDNLCFGNLTRNEAEAKLADAPINTALIRYSEGQKCIILSTKFTDFVHVTIEDLQAYVECKGVVLKKEGGAFLSPQPSVVIENLSSEGGKEKILEEITSPKNETTEVPEGEKEYIPENTMDAQPIGLQGLVGLPYGKDKKIDVAARVKKNLNRARKKQKKEAPTGFKIKDEPLLEVIEKVKSPYGYVFEGNIPLQGEEKVVSGKRVGSAWCEGGRNGMEDKEVATEIIFFDINHKAHIVPIFAVCDGHGGAGASAFVAENLPAYLLANLERHNREGLTDEGIWKALKACFRHLDHDYPDEMTDGTTLALAFILANKLWIANTGDSRLVLNNNGKPIALSRDAEPTDKIYQKKVKKIGGVILRNRVNGELGVARAIGDKHIVNLDDKRSISPNPTITYFPLNEIENGYLIIACDGLWDVSTTEEACQAVDHMVGMSPGDMAKRMVQNAVKNHLSTDNVSVMVVQL